MTSPRCEKILFSHRGTIFPKETVMMQYEICVEGHLDERWQVEFEGFIITHQFAFERCPITRMVGHLADQAALYGALSRLRDLGIALISVQPVTIESKT